MADNICTNKSGRNERTIVFNIWINIPSGLRLSNDKEMTDEDKMPKVSKSTLNCLLFNSF